MRGVAIVGVWGVIGVAACKPAETPKHPEYADRICRAECDRSSECGVVDDGSSCFNECVVAAPPRSVYDRVDYVEAVVACISRASCRLYDGKATSVTSCRGKVRRNFEPSPTVESFCAHAMKRYDDCGYDAFASGQDCLSGFKLYTDEVIHELDDCLTHDCRHIGRCNVATVGEDPAEPKLKKK